MSKKRLLDHRAFLKKPPLWLWISLSPSLLVDGILLFRLFEKIIANSRIVSQSVGSLLVDFLLMLLINALLLKSVPIIIYFVQRSLLKQSYLLIKPDHIVYFRRLWVGYEFDYGFTHFYEYRLLHVDKIKKRCDGSLVVFGKNPVYCFQEDCSQAMDFVGNDFQPRKLIRNRCVIPGVFEEMDKILLKLEQIKESKT
jgi:hypothetical protein